jgi:hypothetical protein
MAQRQRLPCGWALLLLGALALAGCSSKDDSSDGGAGGAGGTAGVSDGPSLAVPDDAGVDAPARLDDGPVAPPADGGPTQAPVGDAGPTRDGGCLPCPSSHQPACTGEVAPKATCSTAGSACCDPDDHFWLCRCVPRDGGPACSWMNACGK